VPVPAADASELRAALAETVGVAAVVTKTRDVAILGRTRIHLDSVEGLGEFVELETVIEGQDEGDAAEELAEVADALGLGAYERIAGSYGDLVDRGEGGV
jgi:predicted adenylyl cyclase CyaB